MECAVNTNRAFGPHRFRQFGGGLGDGIAEHLDQQRMVEVLAQLLQFRGAVTANGRASARDVLLVLACRPGSRPTPKC
jgi:hypothetical protein